MNYPPKTMRAMVLEQAGALLVMRDVAVPDIQADEVLVRVRAVGVGLTINIMLGSGLVTSYPRIPGHELAGDIVRIGSRVETFIPGQRVTCSFFLVCGVCKHCRSGRETLCANFKGFIGMARDGGYAQYVALPARNVVPVPEGVTFEQAAVAADAVATAYHSCMSEAQIKIGDDVLIVGAAGGVGIQTVKMAQAIGARVFAADVGQNKLKFLRDHRADFVIDGAQGPIAAQVRQLTAGVGVDAAVDIVGSKETMEACYDSLAYGGRLAMVGFRPKATFGADWNFTLDGWTLNRGELEVHGSRYVNLAEIHATLRLIARKKVEPVIGRRYSLDQINEAHDALKNNETLGRVVVEVE